jgi:hypothetical protein
MLEIFTEAIRLVNLPFTVLLGVFVLYWLFVIVGALDSDFGDADADLGGHDGHDGHHGHHAEDGGFLTGMFHFINLGEAPLMVVLSILSLSMWICSLIANFYFTEHNALLALAYLVPNLLVSALVTRYVTLPLRPLFRLLRRAEDNHQPMVGRPCRITTSNASSSFGQAEVETNGAPLLIDVRTMDGISLPRGSNAVIFREDTERGIYYVIEASNPQLS